MGRGLPRSCGIVWNQVEVTWPDIVIVPKALEWDTLVNFMFCEFHLHGRYKINGDNRCTYHVGQSEGPPELEDRKH